MAADYERESSDYWRESSEPHQSLATTALDVGMNYYDPWILLLQPLIFGLLAWILFSTSPPAIMALDAGVDYDRESLDYERESSEPHQSLATTTLDGRRRTDRQAAGLSEEMGRER